MHLTGGRKGRFGRGAGGRGLSGRRRIVRLIVLRTGDAAPSVAVRRGEFFAWIRREADSVWDGEWSEHDVRDVEAPLPEPTAADGFIITGSSSSVTERAPWMLRT